MRATTRLTGKLYNIQPKCTLATLTGYAFSPRVAKLFQTCRVERITMFPCYCLGTYDSSELKLGHRGFPKPANAPTTPQMCKPIQPCVKEKESPAFPADGFGVGRTVMPETVELAAPLTEGGEDRRGSQRPAVPLL
jgi:hypothetical protein